MPQRVQSYQWYVKNYPDGARKVLGFLDYHTLFALQLDHIYTSTYFLGLCLLLTASLVACSKTQQFPLLKMAKRWSFPKRAAQVFSKGNGAPPHLSLVPQEAHTCVPGVCSLSLSAHLM